MVKNIKKIKTCSDYLMDNVIKDFGQGSMLKMDGKNRVVVNAICSSGYVPLDNILGLGGYPKSRIIEIYGAESSGKTTLALHACHEIQKLGGTAVFIDAEHALDPIYAKNIGVNIDDLLLSQPDNGEQVFDIIETLINGLRLYKKENKNIKPMIIVIDSIAAMVPKAELEGTFEDGTGAGMGAHARLMSQGLRRLVNVIKGDDVLIMFINQIRSKIGVMFGNPNTTTGGNALKFYASIRLEIFGSKPYEESKKQVGKHFKIKIVKNKCAPPFRRCEGLIRFGIGIDRLWLIFNLLKKNNIITSAGKGWLTIGTISNNKFLGYVGFRKFYKDHKDKIDKLYNKCKEQE